VTDLPDLSTKFRDANLTGLPPLSGLQDARSQALWVLWVAKDRLNETTMTPAEISSVLRDAYGISVSRQKIEASLSKELAAVVRRKQNGRRAYQLMQVGIDELTAKSAVVIFVDPQQALSKIRETQAVLADLRGALRVCDPYVDGRTLDLLADCKAAASIRLLTVTVNKRAAFERDMKAFIREHGDILEVRVASQWALHDRYIIHDDGMLLFGTSLNGLGGKQSFVVSLGEDLRSTVLRAFDDVWSGGSAPL
jgi:hypothetical protein